MHDAYEAQPILEKLPLQIESIASHGDQLLVGTKPGHLLVYTVTGSNASGQNVKVNLLRSNKSFSKRPIQQLACIPEQQILVSLSDALISVHDLALFTLICTINKTRGATLFSVDLKKETSTTGHIEYNLRLCVAVKRKLQLYYWKNRNFNELRTELGIPDVPKAMSWCKESLCVGLKRDYFLINTESGAMKDLFTTGNTSQVEPTVTPLSNNQLALGRDNMSIVIDGKGQPAKKYALSWAEVPLVLAYDQPYLIAVLPKHVEIRTIDPKLLVQNIDLNKPKFISVASNKYIYVASQDFIWRLAPFPITTQIDVLLKDKQFELALHLANMTDEDEADKERRIHSIQSKFAFNLFCQNRFEESMKIFSKLGTDPSYVIGLYPDLLPNDYRSKLEYPSRPPTLIGQELEKGLTALIEYLTQKRQDLMKAGPKEQTQSTTIVDGTTKVIPRKQMSQIVDTTLLKCYLMTNDALVAPLLRLKDNYCHLEETERILKKYQKYSELIILYEKRGLHKKALDLLLRQSQKVNSPLRGHERTVTYLQSLGQKHINVIFEYSKWVLKAHPEDGLKVFTEDTPEVESLPRDMVLAYLEEVDRELAIPYLEHILIECSDNTPPFHNKLIHLYREKVQEMMKEYLPSLPEGQAPASAGMEPGELGEVRSKLLFFLETSRYYIPEQLLTHFPFDGFFEERALLLGRLGRHEQALAIYAHVLKDTQMAEEYCSRNYHKDIEGSKDVYLSLLCMYLSPPEASSLGVMENVASPQPNIDAALTVLEMHYQQIDTAKALELLPPTIHVSCISNFLENVMESKAIHKRSLQVLRSLRFSENLQVREQHIFHQSKKCVIQEDKNCPVCRKKIGNSAFARYPNGVVVHYYCCQDRNICPVDPL
ncbi:vam6/Vps39-like protein [Antedon mediterranea]|uniref:vam6/Vps39-like protein n=1 Tax=Antedon mediterranea TaxID=105859 RepID=UPI003AF8E8B9